MTAMAISAKFAEVNRMENDPGTGEQMDFFCVAENRSQAPARMYHRDDPDTSRQAAERAVTSGLVQTHEARILHLLRTYGPSTGHELSTYAALDGWPEMTQVRIMRRIAKMRDKDRTVAADGTRNRETVWRAI